MAQLGRLVCSVFSSGREHHTSLGITQLYGPPSLPSFPFSLGLHGVTPTMHYLHSHLCEKSTAEKYSARCDSILEPKAELGLKGVQSASEVWRLSLDTGRRCRLQESWL